MAFSERVFARIPLMDGMRVKNGRAFLIKSSLGFTITILFRLTIMMFFCNINFFQGRRVLKLLFLLHKSGKQSWRKSYGPRDHEGMWVSSFSLEPVQPTASPFSVRWLANIAQDDGDRQANNFHSLEPLARRLWLHKIKIGLSFAWEPVKG